MFMGTKRPRISRVDQMSDTVPMPSRCACICVDLLTPCTAVRIVEPADGY